MSKTKRQKNRKKKTSKISSLKKRIRKFDDPILKQVCSPVTEEDDLSFLNDLKLIMLVTEYGIGLSAPQIGVLKNAFVYRLGTSSLDVTTIINPIIVSESDEIDLGKEGCLSYPRIFCNVRRHKRITIEFQDIEFKTYSMTLADFEARLVAHEMDHLQGICKVGDYWRTIIKPHEK